MSTTNTPTQSRWTREAIEAFLAREKPRYQRIELPYGLATEGEDRRTSSDSLLPARLDGKSVLDVGCFLGHFSHESLRRGAARVTAMELNPDRLRQARTIADILGLPIEFVRGDIERGTPPGTFDLVLCLNVVHHLKDPIRGLDNLVRATRDHLVLEIAGLENHTARKLLFGRGLLGKVPRPGLERRPLAVIGGGRKARYDELFFFTPKALEHMLLGHRNTVAKVRMRASPFRGRFVVEAWKRRFDDLMLVCGLPGSGKSTVCDRLRSGDLPEFARGLALDRPSEWVFTGPVILDELAEPYVPRVLFHYDLLRGSALANCGYERDAALDAVDCATRVRAVMVWADPKLLRERLEKRWLADHGDDPSPKARREREERLDFLASPERLSGLLDEWFAHARAKGWQLEFLDNSGTLERITRAEFHARAKRAGLALSDSSSS
ncbi:MAG: methyltransferase domain-containing protein [Planctomycetes bacterium]|nr:methyltransferase domain-containing protein [Planctomycetota bacterium]